MYVCPILTILSTSSSNYSYRSTCDSQSSFFFFNDTATTEIYTLSLHDALPICGSPRILAANDLARQREGDHAADAGRRVLADSRSPGSPLSNLSPAGWLRAPESPRRTDRKSTRLNSSHDQISYAVFCLKKKNKS